MQNLYLLLTAVIGIAAAGKTLRKGWEHQVPELDRRSRRCTGESPSVYLPGRDGRDGLQGSFGPPDPRGLPGSPGVATSDCTVLQKLDSLVGAITKLIDRQQNGRLMEKLDLVIEKMSSVLNLRIESITSHQSESPAQSNPADSEKNEEVKDGGSSGGAVYTRWGRNKCPGKAEVLYTGMVAGSHFQHDGSGSNHLCLPLEPQWNRTVAGYQYGARVYGTEFEISKTNSGFKRRNSAGALQDQRDVQCAVCHTPTRPSHVMIPARLECPKRWNIEYIGFLMAAHRSNKKTEYICVDQDPDAHPSTVASLNGNLLYVVEAACGVLPCPNYSDGFELTCVVCTK